MGLWRKVGYVIAIVMVAAGIVITLAAIIASSNIDTQQTEMRGIAALAGVSLAPIGVASIISGNLLIWALLKRGQIESMEKSLKEIAHSLEVIETTQKELSDKLQEQKQELKGINDANAERKSSENSETEGSPT